MNMLYQYYVAALCMVICHLEGAESKTKKKEPVHEVFDIKPGNDVAHFEHHGHGITCKFTYACQGGTDETWSLDIETSGKRITCTVSRPGGSYLFFQQFKLEIIGGHIVDGSAANAQENLGAGEYTVERHVVSHVDGKFGAELSSVSATVEGQHVHHKHHDRNNEL